MKKILIVAVIIAAVLMVAVGCGGSSDASQVIDKAYQKSMDYKTLHTEFNVELGIDGDLSSISPDLASLTPLSLSLSGNADMDINDRENPAAKGSVSLQGLDQIIQDMAASSGSDDASAALGAGLIGSMLSNIDFVMLDQTAYVNIMETWYQTDLSSAVSGAVQGTEDVDTSCVSDAMQNITPTQILSGIEEIGSEDVDGKSTKHYKAMIDIDKLVDVGTQISRDCGQAEVAGGLEGAKSSLSQMFKKLDVEMWIDGDNNLRKLVLDTELDTAALAALGGTSTDLDTTQALESLSVTLVVTATQSRFDEDVDITAPEGAMPLEDLMGLSDSLGGGLGDLGLGGSSGTDADSATGTTTTGSGTGTSTSPFSMDE